MFSTLKSVTVLGLLALRAAAAPAVELVESGPEALVISLNFNDRNYDDWWLSTTDCDYFMDITATVWEDGSLDPGLRFGEISGSEGTGQAIVKYKPSFDLKMGAKYQVAFSARSAIVDNSGHNGPGLGSNFGDYLQFVVFNAKGNIFSAWPGKGDSYGAEWYRWHWTFTIGSDQDGPAYFGVTAHPTGKSVDWYLDDVEIIKIS
ncbi:hypothetical protein QQZ08_003731 [Neonectria magnoliae]|uniref:Uncharacterized protein n=1 Tax=Neonectria magnoliae TaxID=2732573 RepID=A0ABR1I833_9HYPO